MPIISNEELCINVSKEQCAAIQQRQFEHYAATAKTCSLRLPNDAINADICSHNCDRAASTESCIIDYAAGVAHQATVARNFYGSLGILAVLCAAALWTTIRLFRKRSVGRVTPPK